MLVVGLTGSFGSGKTTVARMFRRCGARIIDADKIARQVTASTGACFRAVVKAFGPGIVVNNRLDRKALADIVFDNSRERTRLESIIHPEVIKETRRIIAHIKKAGRTKVVLVDVPLLFESGMDALCDVTVVVRTLQAKQVERVLKGKQLSKAAIRKRIRAQMPINEKLRLADFFIDNSGTISQTEKIVRGLFNDLVMKHKQGRNA